MLRLADRKEFAIEPSHLITRILAVLALLAIGNLAASVECIAQDDSFKCPHKLSAEKALKLGTAAARKYGYKTDTMYMQFEGPTTWEVLTRSDSLPAELHPKAVQKLKEELAYRCLWSVYFSVCEPAHHTKDAGFVGCLDYPAEIWLLLDGETGKVLHFVRQTGQAWGDRIDH